MLTIIKVFTFYTFPLSALCLCGNREYPGSFQNKLVSSAVNWLSRYILFLAKLKGRGKLLSWKPHCEITSKSNLVVIRDEKVSPFAFERLEIILSLLCFFWHNYKQILQDNEFYDKYADRFQDISKLENPAVSKVKV